MKKLQDFMFLKDLFKYSKLKDFFKTLKFWNIKKWDYSHYQKFLSWALIFFILFNLGLRIPFVQFFTPKVNAENKDFYDLVSIIVDDDIYSSVDSELKRYAKDIEWVLANTKVVLIPTPQDASAFQVASLIESLYYEWYKSVKPDIDFESKLIWTLIVWNVPLPVVKNQENFSKTVLPYTDFDNKTYVYNHEKEVYEKSENLNEKIEPEIWHWVISPNTWDEGDDIDAIKDYFDKNHDFYIGKWLFGPKESLLGLKTDDESGKWLINWNPEEEPLESYVPYVFYFDQFREIEAINAINYNWYKAKKENEEDLVYNRFSKDLAKKVKDQVLWKEEEKLTENITDVFSGTVLPNWDVIWVKKEDDPEPWEQPNGNRYHFRFDHPGAYYGENVTVYFDCNEYEFQVPNWAERMAMSDWRLWKPISEWGTNLVILWPADVELETATIRWDWWEQTVTFTDWKAWLSDYQWDDTLNKTPDILSRYPITENIKSFIEIFNFSALWELRKNIYNAWRYSEPKDKVNADFIPLLISVLDLVSEQVIKNVNDKLENKIDSVVKEWWSSKIIMFEKFTAWHPQSSDSQNTSYKWNWNNEKIYPLLKSFPFLPKLSANSSLSVSYYNGAPEPALLFDQTVTDTYEWKTGRIYVSLTPWWKKVRKDRLINRKWHLIRDNAYFVSDSSVYPWDNKIWWNYITCWDGKTYAFPKANTTVYYSVVAYQDKQEKEWTNEAPFNFTQDVKIGCGDKWEAEPPSDSDEMTYTPISSCWYDCIRYENFFYWTRAADIENAKFCSIYRWSSKWTINNNKWTLVEANRWYNINIIKEDYDKVWTDCLKSCWDNTVCSTMWIWGWNSPINMDDNIKTDTETWSSLSLWKDDPVSKNNNLYRLKEHSLKASVTPLFDIVWSIKTTETCWAGGDNRLVYRFSKKWDKYCWWEWKTCTVEIICGWEIVDKKTFANPGAPPGNEPSNPGSPHRYPTNYAASKKFLWKSAADNAPHNLSILIDGDHWDTCEVCVDGECHDTVGRMDWEDSFVFSPLDCYEWVWIMTENSEKWYNISEGYWCGVNVLAPWTVDYNDIFELLENLEEKYPTTWSESTESSASGSGECKYSRVFVDWNLVSSYWVNWNNTDQVWGSAGSSSNATQPNGDRTHFRFSKPWKDYWNSISVTFDDPQYNFVVEDWSKRKEFSDWRLWKPVSDNDGKLVVLGPFHEYLTSCTVWDEPGELASWSGSEEWWCIYEYKTIPSYIKHDSPSSTTLSKQVKWIVTDAVPIDKDRYVDFIWRNLAYKKINYYPYLFRFGLKNDEENTIENVSVQLKELLDKTSEDINGVIMNQWMPKLFMEWTWTQELYDLYKSVYTTHMLSWKAKKIDLYKELKDLKVSTGSFDWGQKDISYLKTLEFALYWKNIDNISEKYAFILDNYLSDQFTNTEKYGLPKNKKMYELSYMGAPWNATSMYVKMDPEWKTNWSPYKEEESENASLDNMLWWINLWDSYDDAGNSEDTGEFECGPPEWVPIWEWIPAIICWLGTVMPPTIKIWQTECTTNSLFSDEEIELWWITWGSTSWAWWSSNNGWLDLESEEIKACNWDFDKNGINDCIEQSLASWFLDLLTDSTKYAYNSNWIINIALKDKNGDIISADNSTTVNVELSKLDLLNLDWSKTNIFTSWVWTEEEIKKKRNEANKYINFNDSYIKISKWEGQYAFSAKNKDVDVYIKAFIELKDYKSTKKVYLEKIIKVEIRWNNFVATNYKIEKEEDDINITSWVDTILASDSANIYISDGKNTNIEDIKEKIDSSSESKEKLIFSLENYTESWSKIDLKYPLEINLYKKDEKILTKYFNFSNIKEYASLVTLQKSWEYTLEVEDNEWFKFSKTFQVKADKVYSGEITLWSSILEVWWVVSTNFLIVYDKYWNLANSDLYKVEWEVDWDWVEFVKDNEGDDKIDFQMLEWFKIFRIRTTDETDDNTLIFKIKNSSWDDVLEVKNNVETVEGVHLFLQPLQTEIKVWKGVYWYKFSVRDDDWNIMTDFNSRLYLSLNSIYWKSKESFVDVNSWTWQVYFTTKTVANSEVKLSFQIEWLKNIYTKYISILPEKPIKIDLILNKNKIEAKETDYATLKAELKDRYWNIVFNDNSTKLSLEIRAEYKDIISINTWATSTWITFRSTWSTFSSLPFVLSWSTFVSSWSTNSWEILLSSWSKFISSWSTFVSSWSILFKINATKKPWQAYIKVKADPWFESSFTIDWQTPFEKNILETMTGFTDKGELTSTWKIFFTEYDRYNYVSRFYKLEDLEKSEVFLNLSIDVQEVLKAFWIEKNEIWVTAQDENIAKLETFYFWNKDKIDWNYYNSLYTVLLWAEYWDITQKDYLAWGILFDKNNRWLTVTSLLNNPYNYNDIIWINSNWKIKTVQDSQNLTQDIWYITNIDSNKKLNFDIYNYALSEHLGKIYYNLDNWNDLKVCNQTGITFTDCSQDLENTTILIKSVQEGYTASKDWDDLLLKNNFWDIIFKVNNDWEISNNNFVSIENYEPENDLEDSSEVIFSIKEWDDVVGIFSYNLIDWKLNITKDDKILESKISSIKNSIIVYLDSNKYWSRYFESKENSALAIYYNDPFADENDLNIFSQTPWFSYESFKENYKAGWSESNKSLLLYAAWETVWESTKKYASFSLINLWDPVVKLKNVKEKFPSDMEKCDKAPTCEEIEWVDAEQHWINFCDREVKSDLDVKVGWGAITLNQEITNILQDKMRYDSEDSPVVANPWVIFKQNGKWKASTWERMRPNQKSKKKSDVFLLDKGVKAEEWETYWFVMSGLVRMWVKNNQPIKSKIAWMKWGDGEESAKFGECKEKEEDENEDKKPSCNDIKWDSDTDNVCDREIKSDLKVFNPSPDFRPGIIKFDQEISNILKYRTLEPEQKAASIIVIVKKGSTRYGSAVEWLGTINDPSGINHNTDTIVSWRWINHHANGYKGSELLPDDRKPEKWETVWFIISDFAYHLAWPKPKDKIRTEIAWMKRWEKTSMTKGGAWKWLCKITNNDNIVADFFKAIKWITSTDSDALQRLAIALRKIWYDAEAYLEPLWYVDKIQVGGAIFDVRVVDKNHTNRWNEIGPIYLERFGDELPPPWNCMLEEEIIFRSFDSTIWKQISKDEKNVWYKTFDYNNDNLQDILLLKNDSYVEIIENRWKFDFSTKWNLVYMPEMGAGWIIEAWDFTWDWYDDIFYVSKWKPYLLNNEEKNFYKIPLEEQFNMSWGIIKTSAFDMDNDGIKDIVTLDSAWIISIFYWWGTPKIPKFTKLEVWDWYALYLNEDKDDWDWAIYYDWLDNNTTTSVLDNIKEENKTQVKDYEVDVDKKSINLQFTDNIIYDKVSYNLNDESSIDIFDDNQMQDDNFWSAYNAVSNWINDMEEYSNSNVDGGGNNVQSKSFVRNKYASNFWFDIKKEYKDLDGWKLNPLDKVKVVVNIKNTSWQVKTKLAYAEKIPTMFNFSEEEWNIKIGKWQNIRTSTGASIKYNVWDYNFLIDWFFLAPSEEITLEYEVVLIPLSYWEIKTGYFEKWEDWDDEYGDIIIKTDKKSCNTNPDIFKSTSKRAYEKWTASSTCNTDSLELPEEFQKNWLDEDENGVPDYIDELVESAWSVDKTKAIEYSTWALKQVNEDDDTDWIPDTEDATPSYDTESYDDDKDFLTSINEWIDEVSEWIDNVASGLCNWFWWWGCISTPVNWAPLAPWNDPSVMGYPVWDWQKTWEWLPIFSAVLQTWCGYVKVWPPCPNWAWWRFDWAPKWRWENNFRLFVTPTITWAIWLAICFGKNNQSETESPPSLFPIIWTQWKCIIVAFPFAWCKWAWSDWDVQEKNYAENFGTTWWWAWKEETRWEFWVTNWSCVDTKKQAETKNFSFDQNFMSNYIEYKENWSELAMSWLVDSFADIGRWANNVIETEPLIELWNWTENGDTVDVSFIADINVSALANWEFKDVIKLKNTLISSFPQFLMEWVNRQIAEIVTKLTSFPSLIVILPDFSWITDYKWGNFFDWITDAFKSWKSEWATNQQGLSDDLAKTEEKISDMNCSEKTESDDWYFECMTLKLQQQKQVLEKDFNPSQTTSGIKAVYDFIWSLPMVNLKSQTVNVNVPWITKTSLLKAKINFELTKKQRQEELERVKNKRGSLDDAQKSAWDSIIVDAKALIRSLDKNIAIIEEYKKFPENLVKLLNKKEDRLNQIMCSVDTIYKLFWGRLWSNGKRFKAWVELYVLIKAILKSWQIILDLFDEYDKSCKECKNERFDLRTFIWKLVSMIIPKIPVIQFPKWPNIVIDLHNIKVWLDITLPDFNFNTRPIVIPYLPKLYLPDIPNVKIKLPTLPILPSLKIPELPDLPTLPTVELPNLPPPPKLPKILSVIEVVIKILQIVTKIQCLLQKSPFAPEWTAWTKIAYLTDRQGFMSLDFLDMSLPQYSFAFVDSIDVTTYVNFEVEADFILEFVKQWVKPLNNFTNDIVNLFNNKLPDLDFSNVLPDTVEVDLWDTSGMLEKSNSTNVNWEQVINKAELTQWNNLAKFLVYGFYNIYSYIQNNNEETVSNKEFISLVNKWLASKNLWSEENIGKLRTLWKDVANMTYSKEDKFINDLKEKNKAKFDTLKSIINTEKQVTKEQIKSIKDFENKSNIKFIDSITDSNVEWYNELMRKHNFETVKATMNLLTDKNNEQKDLKQDWSKLLARVSAWLNSSMEKLVALNEQESQYTTTTSTWIASTCSSGTGGEIYKYNYKWIYVVEKKEKLLEEMTPQEIKDEQDLSEEDKPKKENYRLFDYIEELWWSEEIGHVDFDNDKDEDILYMVKGELYIKENTKREVKTKNEISDALVLDIDDNKFFNWDIYYEALNNIKESVSFDSFINFSFDAPTDNSINNFRLEFFSIIDKYLNENHDEYIPKGIKKNIIDSFADVDNITKIKEKSQTGYIVSKNIAYINNVWNTINDDIKLTTKEAKNIKESLSSWSIASISVDTKLYAWRTPFILWYYKWDSEDKNEITVGSYNNIKFNEKIRIFSLEWNAYVEWKDEKTLSWQLIKDHLYLPLFSWTKILLEKDNELFNESSHIDIRYYDWTENNIDFRDTRQYELYDLWQKKTTYMIYIKEDNDYYYSRALPFKEWILWTRSSQVLLSPQISSDTTKPDLHLDESIKIPIYQKYTYNFTPYLYDTSWFSDFYIDMDLKIDSDSDWDTTNDRDLDKPNIKITTKTVKADFGPYEELVSKDIWITLKDLAWNVNYKQVWFEVYSPDVEIENYTWTTITWKLEEELANEPVNLYRYRWWVISKILDNIWTQKIYTNSSGAYTFSLNPENNKWLNITKDGINIASVNEYTWKITINNLPWWKIKVLPSNDNENDKSYVKMILWDNTWDIFYQYFNFNGLGDLSEVDNFKDIDTEWIYVKIDNYSDYYYYQLPLTVPYNPWVISIYSASDLNKTALFSIFPDWKIYTKDDNYKLEYSNYWDNIVFKLYDSKKDIYVWEVLMKVFEWNYIVK